jgi:hypothetical protein
LVSVGLTVQAQSASLGVVAGICQVLLAVWQVLGPCSMLQMEAVMQSVLLRLADGERASSTAAADVHPGAGTPAKNVLACKGGRQLVQECSMRTGAECHQHHHHHHHHHRCSSVLCVLERNGAGCSMRAVKGAAPLHVEGTLQRT